MGLAAACQVYLFSIISTPKDSEVSNGKHPVSCVTVIAADYLRLFVLRWGLRNKAAKPPDWAVLQTPCSARQWCVHAAPIWADNDDNHYMVTAEDGCSHAPLHLPSHGPHLHITLLVITAVIHALVFVSSPLQQKIRNISMLGDFFLSTLVPTICRLILLSRGQCNWWEERGTLHTSAAAGAPFPGPSLEPCPGSN